MDYHKYIVDDSPKGHTPSTSNSILDHKETTIDKECNAEHDQIPTLPHPFNKHCFFTFHHNNKTSSTTSDSFTSEGGVAITYIVAQYAKMKAMINTKESASTDNKRVPKHFVKSTRSPSKYIDSFVTTDAKKTVMHPDGTSDCNISVEATQDMSTPAHYIQPTFSKSDSITDIADDESAPKNEKT